VPLKRSKSLVADLGLLYAAAVWGTTFTIVKASLDSIDAVVLVGYRFLIAALFLGLVLWTKKVPIRPSLHKGAMLGIILWLLYVPQTVGLKYTTASNSAFITGLFIVFVPLFSLLFKKKPNAQRLIAVGIALAGLWFLTGGLRSINIGDAITLVTAMTYALHLLFADKWVNDQGNPWALSFVQFLVVGLLSMIVVPFTGASFGVHGLNTIGVVVFLALFPTLSAFVIQLVAQKVTAPVKVAVIFAMEPVFAALYAWTLGGEPMIPVRAVGGLLIVVAMVVSELPLRAKEYHAPIEV
jgi:drug/metabolite transporter (DMT)-like permease